MFESFRKDPGGFLLDEGLRAVSCLASHHPAARPSRYGVRVLRDVAFGPEPWRRLDIYLPATPLGIPLLYLHGGGFRILSKDTHWGMALSFARQGYTVFVPSYRLAPAHPFPAGLEDAAAALLWLHGEARAYQCDPSSMVVAGESAGANFAVALAIATCWERPEAFARAIFDRGIHLRAILPACGMLQVSEPAHRGTPPGFLRDRITIIERDYLPPTIEAGQTAARGVFADVVAFLESAPPPDRPLPPSLAICGGADPILRDTERLTPAWSRHGGRAEHALYPKAGHAFHAFLWTRAARAAWGRQFDFLLDVFATAAPAASADSAG